MATEGPVHAEIGFKETSIENVDRIMKRARITAHLKDKTDGARHTEFYGKETKEKRLQRDSHVVEGLPGKGHIAIHIEGETPEGLLQ
jgi:hypothetical protein